MRGWRISPDRLFKRRNRSRAASVALVFVILLAVLSGCGGGLRHESWPGLLVDGDTIFAANLERVQAFNAETGKLLWSYPDETDKNVRPFYSTPVLAEDYGDNGLLLVAGYKDQTVYALALGASRAERPDLAWQHSTAGGQYVGSGVVADGKFIIGNGDGNVYAFDLNNEGNEAWRFTTGDRVWATPVVVEDTVYVASLDHNLYAVDLATGAEQWHLEMGGAIAATPVYVDGALWVGDFSSTLSQVDLASQSVVWTYEATDWVWATPLLDEATLYFTDVGGHVYALDTGTHDMLWHAPALIEDVLRGQPALSAEGDLLYVAGYEKGIVHALDAATGVEMNWGTVERTPGRLPGDLKTDDEHLYVMPILVGARVKALDPETGKAVWVFPPQEAD